MTPHPVSILPAAADEPRVTGNVTLYRLFDVGYEIHLDRAAAAVPSNAPQRARPVRAEAQALQIRNPPLALVLGRERLAIQDQVLDAAVDARLFDFGTISLHLHVEAPADIAWSTYAEFGNRVLGAPGLARLFHEHLDRLLERLGPAVERRAIAPTIEEYSVFRVSRLSAPGPPRAVAEILDDRCIVPLLLGETRALSPAARAELLPHRFSYYSDDLAVVTWNNALVVEPADEDHDVSYVLEYANAQLLELRVFDAKLDEQLPRMVDRIAGARRRSLLPPRFGRILAELQTLVADTTELVERVENAVKVTDDVYLARIYESALEVFRGHAWRRDIRRKLDILRETYGMLNAESQARRSENLELVIVALILVEVVMALLRP